VTLLVQANLPLTCCIDESGYERGSLLPTPTPAATSFDCLIAPRYCMRERNVLEGIATVDVSEFFFEKLQLTK
jgi:hypothetical protein